MALLTLAAPGHGSEPGQVKDRSFTFVALGDTAYNGERDYPVYEALIDLVNRANPAFTIHVGDIWGAATCGDEHVARIAKFFARFDHPLVYTPGDNEWTDCGNPGLGSFDPVERLAHLRKVFFATDRTLGAKPMQVVRQADVSPHGAFVENARWERSGVLFLTAHVVGSQNHAFSSSRAALEEFYERNRANVAWIDDGFRLAREQGHAAVVIAIHAGMFLPSGDSMAGPFAETVASIRNGADRYGRPVLLIHGDFHRFVIDRPFLEYRGEEEPPAHANLVRLQVYGAPEIRAVEVRVEPDTPWVFGFRPLYTR